MPKSFLKIKNISSEDRDEIPAELLAFATLNSSDHSVPTGIVITSSETKLLLTSHLEKFIALLGNQKVSNFNHFELEKLKSNFDLATADFAEELKAEISQLTTPLIIRTIVEVPQKATFTTFEALVGKSGLTEQILTSALTSFINKDIFRSLSTKEDLFKINISLEIAEKGNAEISGFAYIDQDEIKIHAQWGETNSHEKSDEIVLSAKNFDLMKYSLLVQEKELIIDEGKYKIIPVAEKYQKERKLDQEQYLEIAQITKKISNQFLEPIAVYFEMVNNKLHFTAVEIKPFVSKTNPQYERLTIDLPLLRDLSPLLPGIASGVTRSITKAADLKKLHQGEIALVENFKKDYLPNLKKASGIVLNTTSSFSKEQLSRLRDLGRPTVIGKITNLSSQVVTVDGRDGKVYKGALTPFLNKTIVPKIREVIESVNPKTATKLFVAGSPALNELNWEILDGAGPITPDYFFTKSGIHPKHLLSTAQEKTLTEELENYLGVFSKKLAGKTLIYQLADLKTDQLIGLTAGLDHEVLERNPFLGKRGAERTLENRDLVELELKVFKKLRANSALGTVWLSLPFVRTLAELYYLKKLLAANGLERTPNFKVLVTTSVPANIFLLEEMVEIGIDGVVIDYYDLACLTFGKNFSFNELIKIEDPALEELIEMALVIAKKKRLFTAIVNLPLEAENEMVKKVISWGVSALSVKADEIIPYRKIINKEEKDLVLSRNA